MITGAPLIPVLLAGMSVAYAQQPETSGGLEEIIVTATKREESLQNVPLSIQAIGTERLEELKIKDFTSYVKFLPSVSYTSLGPGFSLAYFRGVASGENNNHSGPQPSVGMYLDEQPITTIQGALDVHLYDIARVEALAGPQGTLYGASSQAGTIRIITNKPDPNAFDAGYGLELNSVATGGEGYLAEGFVNVPVSDNAAIRIVGWARHDAGYIDNIEATRIYPTSGGCISNSPDPPPGCISTPAHAEDDFNDVDTYGGRAALRVELNDRWSITPMVMAQKTEANGVFAYNPSLGDNKVAHFYPDFSEDKWWQAALTVEGKIGNFDVVYAGGYLDRDDVVDADYSDYTFFYDTLDPNDPPVLDEDTGEPTGYYYYAGYGAYWYDNNYEVLQDPSQFIHGTDGYKRQSHELRITSPQDNRLRLVAGLFYQHQKHDIFQNYQIMGIADVITVRGWPNTIWLTNQHREDKDQAVFGELSFDLTDALTATAGVRWFKAESSLKGFFGYAAAYSDNYGEDLCFSDEQFKGSPCTNLDDKIDDDGTVEKFNLTYRFTDDKLIYATYSEGFRPGGINRNGTVPPYEPDILTNYELGWKTTWLDNRLRLNGAIFHEEWDDIQYSFLPPSGSGLTVIKNAGSAEIDGIEADLMWAVTDRLTLGGGVSLLNAELTDDYIPDPSNPPTAFDGDRLPVTPEVKGNLTARYTFPVSSWDAHLQAAVVYTGDTFSDLQREDRAILGKNPSYTIADFSAGLSGDGYTLELYVNNAFDERARTFSFVQCTTVVCQYLPYDVPNQPRLIGLKFTQEF